MIRRLGSSAPLPLCSGWALLCVIFAASCTGQVSRSKTGSPNEPGEPNGPTSPDPRPAEAAAWAPAIPFRRIANDEWVYSAADLLQLDAQNLSKDLHKLLPSEEVGETRFAVPTAIGIEDMERLLEAARFAAHAPAANAGDICQDTTAAEACNKQALLEFASKAFRRPLREDERADLVTLFDAAFKATGEASEALQEARVAVLVSPSFLYHDEAETGSGPALAKPTPLSSLELAARLASWLWRSVPDAELRTSALEGRLNDPSELSRQTRRMVADKKARRAVHAFYRSLLHVEGLAGQVRNVPTEAFSPQVAANLEAELEAFIDNIVFEGDGRLTSLLTSTHARLTPQLAKHYKASSSESSLRPQQRSGVLSLGAVMAALATADEGSPIKRGHLVREKWLCETLPSPPADIPPLPPPTPSKSDRQRIEAHSTVPACAGCHKLMDPIGFAFSAFDAAGQFHEAEAGQAIDSSGSLIDVDESTIAFTDLPEFAQRLSETTQVRSCAVKQWTRFFLGRLETEDEAEPLAKLQETFVANETNLLDLLQAIVEQSAFQPGALVKTSEANRDE